MNWDNKIFQYGVLLLLAFIWGSSFILMKLGLLSFSNEQAAAIRIISAWFVLLPLSIKHLKTLKLKELLPLLIVGFLGSYFPAFLFTKAQTKLDSSMAGMLNSLTPIFTLIVGFILFKVKNNTNQLLGLILGLVGAVGLIVFGKTLNLSSFNNYSFYIVVATLFYGININTIKAKLSHLSGVKITALSFFFIGPPAIYYFLKTDYMSVVNHTDWQQNLLALIVLGVVGTALAMLLMNNLVKYSSPVFASSVTYIIPLFAIMWGVLSGEIIAKQQIVFMILILFGVYLTNKRKQ